MHADRSPATSGLLEERVTDRVLRAFFDVYNRLGYGFLESVYARSLAIELRHLGLAFEREATLDVRYRGEVVGQFRTDLLVESRVIVELKASDRLAASDRAQLLNYLRCSDLEVGLLLHFGPKPTFQRVVCTSRYKHRD